MDKNCANILQKPEKIHDKEIRQNKRILVEFRNRCQIHKDIIPECITDYQLVEFLKCVNYDISNAESLILDHYQLKKDYGDLLFTNRNPKRADLQKMWKDMRLAAFPKLTKDGCQIIYASIINPNPLEFNIEATFSLFLMAIEASFLCDGLLPGHILIGDVNNLSYQHFPLSSLPLCRKMLKSVQVYPINVKALHLLNISSLTHKIYYLMKPFLSKTLVPLIHFHRSEPLTSLQQHISKEYLPQELGGYLESIDKYHQTLKIKIESLESWFIFEETQRNPNVQTHEEV